jgi:biofilm PGA synthesis protein PgaA
MRPLRRRRHEAAPPLRSKRHLRPRLSWPASRAGFLAAVLAALCGVAAAGGGPVSLGREQAVLAARDGRLSEAIEALQQLASAGDVPARHDLVVVLGWAGRSRDAIDLYERIAAAGGAPDYVQRSAAAAYRNEKRFAEAETLARGGLRARPLDAQWARLLSGVLTDSGRGAEAVALMERKFDGNPDDAENWIALGNAAASVPDPFTALRAYAQASRLQPSNREAAAAASRVMSGLGAPFGAAQLAPLAPLALRVDQAGRRVRWAAQLEPPSTARRFEATDDALAEIDRLTLEWRATPGADPALSVHLRFDQTVALRQRERWLDALSAAAALRADGVNLPGYVRLAEADALLALRRPEDALIAYNEVLQADGTNRDAMLGRFYAEIETEDFDAAFSAADALIARETDSRQRPFDPKPLPNRDWLDARILAANARNYADMQAEAWRRMKPLADGAPALAYLRSALASVAAARGWARLADEEIHIASSLEADNRGIESGLAESAMRRQRWPEARERIAALMADFPEDGAVQRAAHDLAAHDLAELEAGMALRHESGNAQAAPGSGIDAYLRLRSQPIAELWRATAAAERMTARPPEGDAVRIRYGLGAQYRGPDVQFDASAWTNLGTLQKAGLSAAGAWTPDDHLWFGAEAQSFAAETPLRALLYGITASSIGASGSYSWDESRSVSAALRMLDFSDGNQRRTIALGGFQRLVAEPHLKLDLRPSLYASSNSLPGAPYFNPSRDALVLIGLEADHVAWRRYERSFSQRLVVNAGSYWQQGYASGAVGGLRYEHVWHNNPLTEWRYGIELDRSRYDGVPERTAILFANLDHHF